MRNALKTYEYRGLRIEVHQDEHPDSPREWSNVGTMVCWHRRYNLGDEQPKGDAAEWFLNYVLGGSRWEAEKETRQQEIRSNNPGLSESELDDLLDRVEPEMESDTELHQRLFDRDNVILPLYLYDHSGITMSTGSFSCPWDSGQVGFIYCSMAKARDEWGEKHNPGISDDDIRKKAIAYLEQEVKTYDDYLTGAVYGYVVASDDDDHIDSCWGYLGYDGIKWHDDYDKCGYMMQCARDAADAHLEHQKELDTQLTMNI